MVKVRWYSDLWIRLDEDAQRRIEEQVSRLDLGKSENSVNTRRFYERLSVRVVKHKAS